ncbi:MAG: ATP synthase F1 subunit delta [Chloroflexi bacterium]|nr:ATP synthase F1 subunit delta [Chloroflexota bacterium]
MAKALARRHAQAIFQIALQQNTLEVWRADLKRLAEALTDEVARHFWDNPRVRLDKKIVALKSVLEGVSPLVLNLAGLLMARGRLGIVNDLVDEYGRMVDAHHGILHADVTTAVALDEASQQKLVQGLGEALGKKVTVKASVDPAILGGMIARVGDRVIDGSIKTRLENLRRGLVSS